MAEMAAGRAVGMTAGQEEEAFYHEAALNAAWTGSRLMIGIVASGLGAFVFAFFYLRSLNSHNLWYPSGSLATKPSIGVGTTIMAMIVVSALVQSAGLIQIKAGRKGAWSAAALVALVLGLAAVGVQIWQLTSLPFQPGGSGFASVFVGASPVFAILVFGTMVWLEILMVRARQIPQISFVEQPPTFTDAAIVQRFQASLSAFTLYWNFMAVAAIVLYVLFYIVH
jgi:heme/copper-type cytochrome/quinol oxidase subunit 3